jgi:hypothetical protein
LLPEDTGFLLSFTGALAVLTNTFLIGYLTTLFKGQESVIAKGALCVLSAGFVCLILVEDYYLLVVLLIPLTVTATIMYTIITSLLTKSVAASETGTVLGFAHATRYVVVTIDNPDILLIVKNHIRSLCGVCGPILGGYLLAWWGFPAIGVFGVATCGIALIGWCALIRRKELNGAKTLLKQGKRDQ